jgi:hypothetical protein
MDPIQLRQQDNKHWYSPCYIIHCIQEIKKNPGKYKHIKELEKKLNEAYIGAIFLIGMSSSSIFSSWPEYWMRLQKNDPPDILTYGIDKISAERFIQELEILEYKGDVTSTTIGDHIISKKFKKGSNYGKNILVYIAQSTDENSREIHDYLKKNLLVENINIYILAYPLPTGDASLGKIFPDHSNFMLFLPQPTCMGRLKNQMNVAVPKRVSLSKARIAKKYPKGIPRIDEPFV